MARASSVKIASSRRPGLSIEAEVVVSAAQVLDERMAATDNVG
jgi:hypothetical protein